jgi:hypothetical protein
VITFVQTPLGPRAYAPAVAGSHCDKQLKKQSSISEREMTMPPLRSSAPPKRMIHPDFAPTPAMISEPVALDHDMTIRLSHQHDSSLADDKSCWTLCNFNGHDLALPPSSRFVSPKMKPSQSARHRFVFSLRTSQS